MSQTDLAAEIATGVKEWLGAPPEARAMVREAMIANLRCRGIEDGERMIDEAIERALTLADERQRHGSERARKELPPPAEDDGRPEIRVDAEEHRVNDEALAALATDPNVYTRGQRLVRLVRPRDGGVPLIQELPRPSLRELLTRHVRFVRQDGLSPLHPPEWCVAALATRGDLHNVRQLTGIAVAPTLRPDGTILDRPGYDEATGLILEPMGAVLGVPEQPTLSEAKIACDELLEAVFDFPFASDAHRSAWLAALLTLFARPAIAGNIPAILIDANSQGSGKGVLADTIAIIAMGHPFPRSPQPREDEEMRKQITAAAIAGTPVVMIDNVTGKVSYRSLDAALTCGGLWSDRILGRSERHSWPLNAIWFLTSNNAALSSDTARRVLPIRLQTQVEHPEDRNDFQHPQLLEWVCAERPRLARAALTCLRAFHVSGRPQAQLVPWGSFEGWCALIRQCVVWLGLRDPVGVRKELRERADVDRDAINALFCGLAPGGSGFTAAEVLERIEGDAELRTAVLELAPPRAGENLPTVQRLGALLRSLRDRVVGGRRLEGRTGRGRALRWRVSPAGPDTHHPHHPHQTVPGDGEDGEFGEDASAAGDEVTA